MINLKCSFSIFHEPLLRQPNVVAGRRRLVAQLGELMSYIIAVVRLQSGAKSRPICISLVHSTQSKLQFANANSRIAIHVNVFRTRRAATVLVSVHQHISGQKVPIVKFIRGTDFSEIVVKVSDSTQTCRNTIASCTLCDP